MAPHPPELAALMLDLGCAGIELAPHPTDTARLRHRPSDLPSDLLARLRRHKREMVPFLVSGFTPERGEASYVFDERLGVADELGMPVHIGSSAWLIAVGESLAHFSCRTATHGVG